MPRITRQPQFRPLAGLLISLLGAACGTTNPPPAQPYQATPAPTTPPPASTPPTSSTPSYPSMGNRLGDPHRIGPDDLQLAVDSAQSSVSGSRLISVEPGTAAGRPVWNVRLLTDGPGMKQVQVDAVVRGAQATDVQAPQADLAQIIVGENNLKTSWPDVVAGLQRQAPGATVSSVVLDTSTPTPTWKITTLAGNQQTAYTVDGVSGAVTGNTSSPRPQQDYR